MERVEKTEPGEEIGEEQGKGRLRRKVNRRERMWVCTGERREKVRENTEMKENVGSQNMRERKLHRSQVCPVWSGLGLETIFLSLSFSVSLCLHLLLPDAFKPSSYPFHHTQTPLSTTPPSFHPRRCGSMSGRRGQEEGFGGS